MFFHRIDPVGGGGVVIGTLITAKFFWQDFFWHMFVKLLKAIMKPQVVLHPLVQEGPDQGKCLLRT